jgi:glyoxylase-like metal-dependent hydrolase (beta-lactamase superfamily II)
MISISNFINTEFHNQHHSQRSAMEVITVPILPMMMLQSHIVRDQKTIIVDTGNPGSAANILAAMKKHQIDPEDVSLILITHSHLDHSGGAAELQGYDLFAVICRIATLNFCLTFILELQ